MSLCGLGVALLGGMAIGYLSPWTVDEWQYWAFIMPSVFMWGVIVVHFLVFLDM